MINTEIGIRQRGLFVATCLLAVTLSVATLACKSEPASREFDAKDVVEAGNSAVEHGRKMQELGALMVQHGQAINDTTWGGDGQHWVIDGKNLVEVGQRAVKLGQSMRGNPIKAQEVELGKLRAQGQGLIADGQAFVEHGKVMVELTELLKRRAESSGDKRLMEDVVESARWSQRMSDIGEQLTSSGRALVGFADTLAKSIGR